MKNWTTHWPINWTRHLINSALWFMLGLVGPGLINLENKAQANQSAWNQTHQLQAHAKALAGQPIDDIDRFLDKLLAPARSDRDKAWLIYNWAIRHFRYDGRVAARLSDPGQQQLERLIRLRRGSCAVYAHVTTQLLQKAGLDAQSVVGQATADKEQGNGTAHHVWTQLWLDQQWWTIDSTWGSGYMDEQGFVAEPSSEFFMFKPEQNAGMYYNPTQRFKPQMQLSKNTR